MGGMKRFLCMAMVKDPPVSIGLRLEYAYTRDIIKNLGRKYCYVDEFLVLIQYCNQHISIYSFWE
jgi:hypothetical protein